MTGPLHSTHTTLYLLTLNCARALQTPFQLAASLARTLPSIPPHVLVLSIQELAPLSPAFLSGLHITAYTRPLQEAITIATERAYGAAYTPLITHAVGFTTILLFTHPTTSIQSLLTAGTGLGFAGILANKGSAALRIKINNTITLTFVAAHFAPDEYSCDRRDKDWENLVRRTIFTRAETVPGDDTTPLLSDATPTQDVLSQIYPMGPDEHLFVLGDLNYRTAHTRPTPQDYDSFPKSGARWGEFAALWSGDQLSARRAEGRTAHALTEATVRFPPTYKYAPNGVGWARKRWPSWADRVLFLEGRGVEVVEYGSIQEYHGSDHKPVYAVVEIPEGRGEEEDWVRAPFEVDAWWRERRRVARCVEVVAAYAWIVARSYVSWALLLTVGFWATFGAVGMKTA